MSIWAMCWILCLSWQGTSTWDGNSHSSALPRLERYVFPACWRTAMFCAEMQCPLWPFFYYSHLQALFILIPIFTLVSPLFLFFVPPADDFSSQENLDVPEAGGWDAMLSSEDEDEFFDLQIVKHYDGEVRMWPTYPWGSRRLPSCFWRNILKPVLLPGESRSHLGFHGSWMSTAESRGRPRSESILDRPHRGTAQPPSRDAASPAQTHLCEPHWTTGAAQSNLYIYINIQHVFGAQKYNTFK